MANKILSYRIGLLSTDVGAWEINAMVKNCQGWGCRFILVACAIGGAITLAGCLAIAFTANQVLAEVTSDNTLNTQVTSNGNVYEIRGGAPVPRNDGAVNLFHSFDRFRLLNSNEIANFLNENNVVNIFGRVTGGTPSDIQGTIQVQGTANLFLINPSGIIFGPNARLDLQGGSFVGTTASEVRFPNGGVFSMNSPVAANDTLLTVNPSALFFNSNPRPIVNQSIAPNRTDSTLKDGLRVPDGQNLFLVGGDVRLENGGTVRALGGRIELGGLAGTGEVKIEELTTGTNPQLKFPNVGLAFPDGVTRANVSLTNGAIVDVVALGEGNIAINAKNIDISGESFVCAGLGTTASSCNTPSTNFGSSNPKAGNIALNATGVVKVSQSRIENNVNPGATGNSDNIFDVIASGNFSKLFGSIVISTGSLSITDGASVSTSTFGNGNAGLVFVDASDSVSLSGYVGNQRSRIASAVVPGAVGAAGGILIRTGSLSLTDHSLLNSSTSGQGDAGAVVVEASRAVSLANDSVIFNNVEAGGQGAGGLIDITAESLSLTSGAQMQTLVRGADGNLQPGKGSAGEIKIKVRDTVTVSGVGNPAFGNQGQALPSAIFSNTGSGVTGNAGNIQISTGSLSLSDRGYIDTSLGGVGVAGSIFIDATDSVSLSNNAEIRTVIEQDATQNTGASNPFAGGVIDALLGKGGDVTGTIRISTGSLSLTDGSVLNTSTLGNGNAGAVVVEARDDVTLKGAEIDSVVGTNATGDAGAILMSVGSLSITSTANNPAGLTTETLGAGDAGLILVLADKDISIRGDESGNESGIASRVAEGRANTSGAIFLDARSLFLRDGGFVNVDNKGSGLAGDINIQVREDVILRDGSKIRAISASGEGGNIYINQDPEKPPGDFLVLVNGSQVSTQVGNGLGGNIRVNARYIIAAPFKNNNIDAFADSGKGGEIDITTNRLYDIAERVDVPISNDIDPTARSGVNGILTATVLNIDPTQGLSNLPTNPIDPTRLIAETCAPRGGITERQKNQFIVTNRGGLPPDPNAAFPGEAVVSDEATPNEHNNNQPNRPGSTNPTSSTPSAIASPQPQANQPSSPSSTNPTSSTPSAIASQESNIVEAQSWVFGKNGDVIFTAPSPTATSNYSVLTPASTCNGSSTQP